MDTAHWNESGAIVESFVKPIASTIFGHQINSLDGPGPSISISGPHEEFFKSAFGIWWIFYQMVASYQSGFTRYGGP